MSIPTDVLANTHPYQHMPSSKHVNVNTCPYRHISMLTHIHTNTYPYHQMPTSTHVHANTFPYKHMSIPMYSVAISQLSQRFIVQNIWIKSWTFSCLWVLHYYILSSPWFSAVHKTVASFSCKHIASLQYRIYRPYTAFVDVLLQFQRFFPTWSLATLFHQNLALSVTPSSLSMQAITLLAECLYHVTISVSSHVCCFTVPLFSLHLLHENLSLTLPSLFPWIQNEVFNIA